MCSGDDWNEKKGEILVGEEFVWKEESYFLQSKFNQQSFEV